VRDGVQHGDWSDFRASLAAARPARIAAGLFNQPQPGVRQQTGMVAGDNLQLQMQSRAESRVSRTENCCPFTANQTFVNWHTRFEIQAKQKSADGQPFAP